MPRQNFEEFSPLSNNGDDEGNSEQNSCCTRALTKLREVFNTHFFLIAVVVAIVLASAAPGVGKSGGVIYSQYSISYGATISIFILTGLSLKTSELAKAFRSLRFNCYTQCFNFLAIPAMTYPIVKLLSGTFISPALLDGLLITACLPCTVNMCTTLTTSSHGDVSAAVFNASVGNLIGIFLTPLLLLGLMHVHSSVSFAEVLVKLVIKVLAPMALGQAIQYLPFEQIGVFVKEHKFASRRLQEILLVAIVYATFCDTFSQSIEVDIGDLFAMAALVTALLVIFMASTWVLMRLPCFNFSIAQRIAGLFCSTHKTVAMGIPLISTVFENSDELGLFTLPLLMYHPLQLLLGSVLVPYLRAASEEDEASRGNFAAPSSPMTKPETKTKTTSAPANTSTPDTRAGINTSASTIHTINHHAYNNTVSNHNDRARPAAVSVTMNPLRADEEAGGQAEIEQPSRTTRHAWAPVGKPLDGSDLW